MLQTIRLLNNASVARLVKLWTQRYVPNLSAFSQQENSLLIDQLVETATPEGKKKTVANLKRLIQINCECAAIKTDVLFSYIPNVVNLSESQKLGKFVAKVYEATLSVYQQQPAFSTEQIQHSFLIQNDHNLEIPGLEIAGIEQIVRSLTPDLLQLQKQHLIVKDPRTIGFMTTQFHFSTQLVLNRLTIPEQVLISPYFKFIEEQVCMPWQRVCNAAASHSFSSQRLAMVEQLLPQSYEIAYNVYQRAARLYPYSSSLRGNLSHPGIMASTLRDLQMFQSYLWLSVLEGNINSMEQALLPLCVMVFPSIGVTWQLVRQMLQLLVDELIARLEPEHKSIVLPYTQAMQQLFSNLEIIAS
jgi:Phycobilisome protein